MLQHGGADTLQPYTHTFEDNRDKKLQNVYNANRSHILANHKRQGSGSVYNFPVQGLPDLVSSVDEHLKLIDRNEQNAYKINLSLGILLKKGDKDKTKYRYYIPYTNKQVLESPFLVRKPKRDLGRLSQEISRNDLNDYVRNHRPNTKWSPEMVTNVSYYVTPTAHTLGDGSLPNYIKYAKSIVSLEKNTRNVPYSSNLCTFRALACHYRGGRPPKDADVHKFFKQWCKYIGKNVSKRKFAGVPFELFPDFEDCFKVNLNVYEMLPSKSVIPRYRSETTHPDTVYFNIYCSHISYIKDFSLYSKSYQCATCNRLFDKIFAWRVHMRSCSVVTKHKFPGGFLSPKRTIFEELADWGINVASHNHFYPWFIVFDFESILQQTSKKVSETTTYIQKHVPISVSVSSNVDGYDTPVCIVNADTEHLIVEMLQHMSLVKDRARALARDKWKAVFKQMHTTLSDLQGTNSETFAFDHGMRTDMPSDWDEDDDDDNDDDDDGDDDQGQEDKNNPNYFLIKDFKKVMRKFRLYCDQVPVLSFNGSRYDLNLIKAKLIKCLDLANDGDAYVIKKTNSYVSIVNSDYRFLDVSQFLAPCTYAGFLKAFQITGVDEQKSFFCYDYLDSVEKLEDTELPSYDKFYSSLKKRNVLEVDGDGETNYKSLQELWRSKDMKTLKDLLIYYNTCDVVGFVAAVTKMIHFYQTRDIDLFKDYVSVPGVARRLLFKSNNCSFPLFDHKTQDIFRTVSCSAVGGPSIVFRRFMKVGESNIRDNINYPCRSIQGEDMNSLYLATLNENFPTGVFVDRKCENMFKAEPSIKHMSMYFWMDHLAQANQIVIKHKLNNNNKEVRIGPYPVDGYCCTTKTVYEFNGCYYHPHEGCSIVVRENQLSRQRINRTNAKRDYIRRLGYTLIEIQECKLLNVNCE